MARCRDAEVVALAEVQASFPVAHCLVEWSDRVADRAVVVIAVDQDATLYLHQMCCLCEDRSWFSWTEGKAPGWLAVDGPMGVVTRADVVEPGTTMVKVQEMDGEEVVNVDGRRLYRALWQETDSDVLEWPPITALYIDGEWSAPALPEEPVRASYLVETYLGFERNRSPDDEWAWSALDDAARTRPRDAWVLVLEALRRAPDDQALMFIAAGPLEELIVHHLGLLIDDIERAAVREPRLPIALGGVWVPVADKALADRLVLAIAGDTPSTAAHP